MCHMEYGDFVIDSGEKANINKLDCLRVRSMHCIEYRVDVDKRRDLPNLYHRYCINCRMMLNSAKFMYYITSYLNVI